MQRFARQISAIATVAVALLMSGVGTASADETGDSNGSILSGNNLDLDLLNNVTVCDIAVAGLIGLASTAGCEVENEFEGGNGDDVTGDSNGSILSGNNVDIDALNNLTVCDIAVAGLIGLASTAGCDVENEKDGNGDNGNGDNGNGDNGNGDNGNGDNGNGDNGNGDNGNGGNGDGGNGDGGNGDGGNGDGENGSVAKMLPATGAGVVGVLLPVGLALVLVGAGLLRRTAWIAKT